MNFESMDELRQPWAYPTIPLCASAFAVFVLLAFLRRVGLLSLPR
jgi:hypothetical protein